MHTAKEQPVTRDEQGRRKGIFAAARDLGVTYTHLYLVLDGKRDSAKLKAAIHAIHPELEELHK